MAKSLAAVIAFVLFATCAAEPARFRTIRTNRFSARQEVGSGDGAPAKAPYPPAGLRPDVPFELPTETTTTPPQPDNTYLPPESVPESTYAPQTTTNEPATTNEPTTTYETTTTNELTTTNEPTTTNEATTTDEVSTTTLSPEAAIEEPDFLTEDDDDDDTESVISVAVSYDNDNSVVPLPQAPQRIVYAQSVRPLQARSDKLRVMRAQPILLEF